MWGKKEEIEIEKDFSGKPHEGKVLAVIFPHADDFSIFTGGTVTKLIREGYTGYMIRTTNDEKDSYDLSVGETILRNEHETQAMAEVLGIKKVFDFNYRNHYLDAVPPTEIRHRLIMLFRFLKVDTVISFDPWGHYEENPDHYITAQAVEAACWMAAGHLDLPEHLAMGLQPHKVTEKYYCARGPQLINRVVDVSSTIDLKIQAMRANKTQIGNMIHTFKDTLQRQHKRIPNLEAVEEEILNEYIDSFFREGTARIGQKYGLKYAEAFHYIGPDRYEQAYIEKNAVPLQ